MYPTFYQFNVAAKTFGGLWITSLTWNFGDGSTLFVPFSAEREVSDVRFHSYSQPGIYVVSVTAYDNLGNSGSTQVAVYWFLQNATQSSTQVSAQVSTQLLTTYVASGTAYGSISPNCPSGCPEAVGSLVTITISTNAWSGLVFASWTILGASCSGASINPCTFTMPDNPVTVSANFTPNLAFGSLQILLSSQPTNNRIKATVDRL